MDLILRKILRTGLRRGLSDQNWPWLVMAGCALVLRRGLRSRSGVVSSLKIAPGEQVMISVRDRTTPVATASSPDEA